MDYKQAKVLCDRWLPAWTGGSGSVERLLGFYSPEALYRDPARPEGIRGRDGLRGYFQKLLAKNPDWRWEADEIVPTERGFVLKWLAHVPAGSRTLAIQGLDIVEVENGLITRNEVYFDRAPLIQSP